MKLNKELLFNKIITDEEFNKALETLNANERSMIYFQFNTQGRMVYSECGKQLNLSGSRCIDIQRNAFRKIREFLIKSDVNRENKDFLSVRAENVLKTWTKNLGSGDEPYPIECLRNCGKKTAKEIIQYFYNRGLDLRFKEDNSICKSCKTEVVKRLGL